MSRELNKLNVTKSWGSHGYSVHGVYWTRWTGSEDGEITFETLQEEQKRNRDLIEEDRSEMRNGDQRPIFFLKCVERCIKLSLPLNAAARGEKLSATPAEPCDIEIQITGKTYRYSTACGWQVADFLAISTTGRVTLKSFTPRCDSFLGRVLRDLGIAVLPSNGMCCRSCCWG